MINLSGNKDLVELLIKKGADVNARTNYYEQTPLHFAAEVTMKSELKLTNIYSNILTKIYYCLFI